MLNRESSKGAISRPSLSSSAASTSLSSTTPRPSTAASIAMTDRSSQSSLSGRTSAIRRPPGVPCGAGSWTGSIGNVASSCIKVKGMKVTAFIPFICGQRVEEGVQTAWPHACRWPRSACPAAGARPCATTAATPVRPDRIRTLDGVLGFEAQWNSQWNRYAKKR